MKITTATKMLEKNILRKKPVFLWGPPGVGKSSIVFQVARLLGYLVMDIRAALLDPVDLRGIPIIEDGCTVWKSPHFLPREGRWILFLDELNLAVQMVQSACYQLILDRRLGDYVMPPESVCIGAGNRETDRCNVYKMSTALASRFHCHIEIDSDIPTWTEWALHNDVHPAVIAFTRLNPTLLYNYDPNLKAFCCFRSLVSLSDEVKTLNGETDEEMEETFRGIVGNCSITFLRFWKNYRRLPNPMEILKDPYSWDIPKDIQTNADNMHLVFSVVIALAKFVDKKTFGNMIAFLKRLPMREFMTMGVCDSTKIHTDLKETGEYVQWAIDEEKRSAA